MDYFNAEAMGTADQSYDCIYYNDRISAVQDAALQRTDPWDGTGKSGLWSEKREWSEWSEDTFSL